MGGEKMNRAILAAVATGLLGLAVGWYVGGKTGFAYASIDLSCGDKTYTVSTGNNKGECKSSGQNAVCGDTSGNTTEVSCASGCINSNGSATCSVKAQ